MNDNPNAILLARERARKHHPRCQWEVAKVTCNCAQLCQEEHLERLTEEMRRFTQKHGPYQAGQ